MFCEASVAFESQVRPRAVRSLSIMVGRAWRGVSSCVEVMAELRIENLAKTFKGGIQALGGISFDVADREAVFLLGPSGAGRPLRCAWWRASSFPAKAGSPSADRM